MGARNLTQNPTIRPRSSQAKTLVGDKFRMRDLEHQPFHEAVARSLGGPEATHFGEHPFFYERRC
jgi:hypothetical protein